MTDLTSRGWIVAKGCMFGSLVLACAVLLLMGAPSIRTAFLVLVLVWSAARFYYFLFYVLEKYVDPELRYSGLLALLRQARRRRGSHGGR